MQINSAKKRLVTIVFAIAALQAILIASADELPSPGTNELKLDGIKAAFDSVTNNLLQIVPEADIYWDTNSNAYYQIVLKQGADRLCKAYIPSRRDILPPREVSIKVPPPHGFSMQIRFREGKYHEQLVRNTKPTFPKTAAGFAKAPDGTEPDFYTDTVLTEFPDQNMYMVTDIQYGTEMDTNILARVYELLKSTISANVTSIRAK